MCQYDTFCLKIAWACKIYIFSGVVWGIVVKGGEIVNGGGDGDERGEGVGEIQILTDCGDRCGVGNTGERWNVWGLGVRVCIILYILLYIIILLWGLGGGDGSATPSEHLAAVSEFGNNPPCE